MYLTAGPLADASEKYSIAQYDFGQYTTRFRLTIHDFSLQDVGSYQCICSNPISTRVEGDVRLELQPGKCIIILVTNKSIYLTKK